VCSPTFEQWLSEAAAAGRPLKEQEVCAAYLYHYHKNGLPAEQEAIYQQSWRKLGGGAWYDRFLNQRINCAGCGEYYRRENVGMCYDCLAELCGRCGRQPHRLYL
jgi:hypothetical protein